MAVQSNTINDMSVLTGIPVKILTELTKKTSLCIGSTIHDALLQKENVAVINIGIGTLSVELSTQKCKFVPSKELKHYIKQSIEQKIDPVEYELTQEMIKKLLSICGETM